MTADFVGMNEINKEEKVERQELRPEAGEEEAKEKGRAVRMLCRKDVRRYTWAVVWPRCSKNQYFSLTKCLEIGVDLICRQYYF